MRILTCDDHAIFRAGLRDALAGLEADLVESSDCDEAFRIVKGQGDVDLVLLDLALPGMDGFTGLRKLRTEHPEIPVVIVSASEDPQDVLAALDAGASGFIPKSSSPDVLRGALQLVFSGSVYIPPAALPILGQGRAEARAEVAQERVKERAALLTARQVEVLTLMSRGLTNKEIGSALDISPGTVKTHLSAIFEALEVTNRTEAVLIMKQLGLDPADA